MIFLGCSIIFAMILYLVDKNGAWRQFFWISRALFLIVLLVLIIFLGTRVFRLRQAQEAHSVSVSIPAEAVIVGRPIKKPFGNATVQADTAFLYDGTTLITEVHHPTSVLVFGEAGSKYKVQLADGRTGQLKKNEVKMNAKAAIPNQDMKLLP